jgi:hypothetical protein
MLSIRVFASLVLSSRSVAARRFSVDPRKRSLVEKALVGLAWLDTQILFLHPTLLLPPDDFLADGCQRGVRFSRFGAPAATEMSFAA